MRGALLAAALALSACAVSHMSDYPEAMEAISLLGDTLWALPPDPREGPQRVEDLKTARIEHHLAPNSLTARLLLGRRTAEMGRIREAVGLFEQALWLAPADPRPSRWRGEMLLRLRNLGPAQADLRHAVRQSEARPLFDLEYGPEGDVVAIPLLHTSSFYLGVAHYVRGQYPAAHEAFQTALASAATADDVILTALWLYFTVRRLDRMDEAAEILSPLTRTIQVGHRHHELRLLLAYKGDYPADSIQHGLFHPASEAERAVYGYGLGYAMAARGQLDDAAQAYTMVLRGWDWSNIYYLAAEAELAEMRKTRRAR